MRLNEDYFNNTVIDTDEQIVPEPGDENLHRLIISVHKVVRKERQKVMQKLAAAFENIVWIDSVVLEEKKDDPHTEFRYFVIIFKITYSYILKPKDMAKIALAFDSISNSVFSIGGMIDLDNNYIETKDINKFNAFYDLYKRGKVINDQISIGAKRFIINMFYALTGNFVDMDSLYSIVPLIDLDTTVEMCNTAIEDARTKTKKFMETDFWHSERIFTTDKTMQQILDTNFFRELLSNNNPDIEIVIEYVEHKNEFYNVKGYNYEVLSKEEAIENPQVNYMPGSIRMAAEMTKGNTLSTYFALVFPFKYVFTAKETCAYCMVIYGKKNTLALLSLKLFYERKP